MCSIEPSCGVGDLLLSFRPPCTLCFPQNSRSFLCLDTELPCLPLYRLLLHLCILAYTPTFATKMLFSTIILGAGLAQLGLAAYNIKDDYSADNFASMFRFDTVGVSDHPRDPSYSHTCSKTTRLMATLTMSTKTRLSHRAYTKFRMGRCSSVSTPRTLLPDEVAIVFV